VLPRSKAKRTEAKARTEVQDEAKETNQSQGGQAPGLDGGEMSALSHRGR
jgi:hypothetical protein